MKLLIQILLLAGFMAVGATGNAAPRAAEDPTAVVISTNDSAPYVKRQAPKQSKSAKATPKKKAGSKKAKPASSKKVKKAK